MKCSKLDSTLQVCAVVVYMQAKLEAESSSLSPVLDQESSNLFLNEDVFISQLIRRAVLLNGGFQKKVTDIVQQHGVNDDVFCFLRTPSTAVTSSELYERARNAVREDVVTFHRLPSSTFVMSETHERTSNKTGGGLNTQKLNINIGFKSRCRTLILRQIALCC